MTPPKNPQRLVKVLAGIAEKYPKMKAAIIGTGDLEADTKQAIAEHHAEHSIDMLGYSSNPYGAMKQAKILIMTSRWEGLPMCALEAMAFVAATKRVGLSLNYDSMQLSDYRISCVGTALKLYDQLGEEIYCEALRHIVAAWEGRPDSFRAAVLRGVMYFVQLYHGQYSAERLVRALGSVHPMELYRISRDNPAKLPGWRRYVYPIYTTYNGKCRKDALPMKF